MPVFPVGIRNKKAIAIIANLVHNMLVYDEKCRVHIVRRRRVVRIVRSRRYEYEYNNNY